MNKPIIGITTRKVKLDDKYIEKVPYNLIDYVKRSGGIPLLIPYNEDILSILDIFQGFIIPGGVTFNKTDEAIIKYALKNDIPLLGICAGMQAIGNICNFNSSKSDQTVKIISKINHNSKNTYVHEISILNHSLLFKILKKSKIIVNSRHQYKVKKENFFIVDAYSSDHVIEAIHIPNTTFILGLEWHPEDLNDEDSQKIFKYFISTCQKKCYNLIEPNEFS